MGVQEEPWREGGLDGAQAEAGQGGLRQRVELQKRSKCPRHAQLELFRKL